MSISNLHTLLNRPWYIDQNYGASHLPILFNLLEGKNITSKKSKKNKTLSFIDLNGNNTSSSSTSKSVAILNIKNPIVKHDQFCGPQGTKSMMRQLDKLKTNESIAGVVLDVDSGGGQSYGTPEFYDYILTYPKPIVSYTDGYMCSAAYYISSASKHIVANKRAEAIGSIGAYSQILDLTGYYKKQGAKLHTIYGTKSTEKNKAYREVLKGNYTDYIKEELDPLIDTFISDMKSARPGINEDVYKGGTFSGPNAKEKGLVDDIGTIQTAINKVFELAEATNNNSNTNNSKNKTMSKLNVPLIEAVIGSSFSEGETESGIILTDDQATALETRLSENDNAISIAVKTSKKATKKIAKLKTSNSNLTNAIQTALKNAEVEGAENMTNEEGINALSALVTEYGSEDGGKTTETFNDGSKKSFVGAATSKLQSTINNL